MLLKLLPADIYHTWRSFSWITAILILIFHPSCLAKSSVPLYKLLTKNCNSSLKTIQFCQFLSPFANNLYIVFYKFQCKLHQATLYIYGVYDILYFLVLFDHLIHFINDCNIFVISYIHIKSFPPPSGLGLAGTMDPGPGSRPTQFNFLIYIIK